MTMQPTQSQRGIEGQSRQQSQIEQQQPAQVGGSVQSGGQSPGGQGYAQGATQQPGSSQQMGSSQPTGGQMGSSQPMDSQMASSQPMGSQMGSTQQMSGQMASSQPMGGQTGGGLRLDDALTEEMRVALRDFELATNVTEWCAEQCIDEGAHMAECIRLCRDVAEIASLNAKLIARDSAFGPDLVEVFVEAADACARECAQHQHAHCQECASVLPQAIQSAQEMLTSFESQGAGGSTMGGQSSGSKVGISAQGQMSQQF